ncbi:MAG: DNA polymerase III subunit gamma/tau [Campylobacter sp.]
MQTLALKYRPRKFDELIGQETIFKSLCNALNSGRLGHAYLFSGLRGSGKTSTARIFAKSLVCSHGPTALPCEMCENCAMANTSRHIDIIELDAASHRKIDDIRELIEQSRYAPSVARFKVFIIDEVHMLTKEAFNALLKTLEEPPSYVKFILATTDPLKLPATVLSRTQHFHFKPIARGLITKHLAKILQNENVAYEDAALEILARSGSGSLRDTITLLDQAIIYSKENVTASAVSAMLGLLDPQKISEILSIAINQDKSAAINLASELENYDAGMIIDEIIAILKEKFLARDASFSVLMFERFFRILSEAKKMLISNSDNAFTLLMTLFLMMEAVNLREIDDVIEGAKIDLSLREADEIKSSPIGVNRDFNAKFNNQTANTNLNTNINLNTKQSRISAPNFTQTSPQNLEQISPQQNFSTNQTQNTVPNVEISRYSDFIKALINRDIELGECFKNYIDFVGFDGKNLALISRVPDEKRDFMRRASKGIRQVLSQIYGENAKIQIENSDVKKNHSESNLRAQSLDNKISDAQDSKLTPQNSQISNLNENENANFTDQNSKKEQISNNQSGFSQRFLSQIKPDLAQTPSQNFEQAPQTNAQKIAELGAKTEQIKQVSASDILHQIQPNANFTQQTHAQKMLKTLEHYFGKSEPIS